MRWANYENLPKQIGIVVSAKMATLHELDTVYGVMDLYDILEIMSVDNYNQALAREQQARDQQNRAQK